MAETYVSAIILRWINTYKDYRRFAAILRLNSSADDNPYSLPTGFCYACSC